MAKVYVSSTFVDLKECRQQVSLVLRRMGHEDVAMEYYTAGDQRPVDKCLEDAAACDLYVGIFAWRYGWIPPDNNPDQLSITEMEYRQAARKGTTCLIFLLHEDAPWPRKFIDRDPNQIEKLRTYLSDKHTFAFFTSAEGIGSVVTPAVYQWAKDQGHIARESSISEFDLDAYYTALKKRYNRIDLEGLTPPQKEEYLQLHLRSIFVEQSVRENLPPVELSKESWERLRREKEIHPEDLPYALAIDDIRQARTAYYEKPLRAVLDVLTDSRHQQAIILGDPGSGKSTLARYVLLSLIDSADNEKLRRAFDGYLPILVELRSYAGLLANNKCDTFLEFLEFLGKSEGWRITADALHQHMKNDGRAVVIFDGLDEIFDPEDRERISRQIVGFASDYPKVRIIATSRVIGYRRGILSDADFSHFTLQDLGESQVATFVSRWYELALNDRHDEVKEKRERILRSFKESASIRQLAGNPMLLTIMAIIGKHQELPRERWKLYDHAASVLIELWDVNKHLRARHIQADFIGEEEKKEMLRRLALQMQNGAGGLAGNYIHRDELQAVFESYLKERYELPLDRLTVIAREIINQLRERNFILSLFGANLYGFVHRAFLEYFSASAFINKFEKTHEMTIEELKRDVYGAHWEDRSWHEVFRLICGMIDEKFAGEIIDCLMNVADQPRPDEYDDRPPWNIALAVQCLGEVRNPGTVAEPARRLLKVVCSLFDYVNPGWSGIARFLEEQIATSAEMIGPNWPHRMRLVDWLNDINPSGNARFCERAFGKFTAAIGAGLDEIRNALLDYATHSDAELRFLAPFALATGWRDDAQALSILLACAIKDANGGVRSAAVSALAQHFRDDHQTLPMLLDRAVKDYHYGVRSAAVTALARHFRDDHQTLPMLLDRAVKDYHEWVRRAAVTELAQHFRDDPQAIPMLLDRAVYDSHYGVRRAAVTELAQHFRDDPQTLPMLFDRGVNDSHEWVRRDSVTALAQHFRDAPQTMPMLLDRASNDPNDGVRIDAVTELAQHFRDAPQTMPMLLDRAVNDSHDGVRSVAVTELAQHFRDDPQTLPMLLDRAVYDSHYKVSIAAVTALAKHFRDDPQTLPMLLDRASNDPNGGVRSAAVTELARHFRDDPQTMPMLLDRAVKDYHTRVSSAAVTALAQHFRDDLRTLPMLLDRTVKDANDGVRSAAIIALAQHFRDDLRTLPMLLDRASNDPNRGVRRAAVTALAQHFRDDHRTLPMLFDRAVKDSHESGRRVAITALAQHFRDDHRTLPMLLDRASSDPNEYIRNNAVFALTRHFRNDPQIFPLLLELARGGHNAGASTRVAVIQKLVRWWQDDPETLPLIDSLSSESNPKSLQKAAKEAAMNIRNHLRARDELTGLNQRK